MFQHDISIIGKQTWSLPDIPKHRVNYFLNYTSANDGLQIKRTSLAIQLEVKLPKFSFKMEIVHHLSLVMIIK